MPRLERKTHSLRKGRWSCRGTSYFLTIVTQGRYHIFNRPDTIDAFKQTLAAIHTAGKDGEVLCASAMPDHLHVLITLTGTLSVSQLTAKIKQMTRSRISTSFSWQSCFFEHRLRPDELLEDYGLYIFLNPFMENEGRSEANWNAWWCPDSTIFRFLTHIKKGVPPPKQWYEHLRQTTLTVSQNASTLSPREHSAL